MLKRLAIALLVATLIAPAAALGQTRRRSSKPTTPSQSSAQKIAQVRNNGATEVATQIKLMTKFIYLLGGAANGIAAVDDAIKKNQASPQLIQSNEQNKAVVKKGFQDFREGLDRLEISFRNQPELQPYYIQLAGSAAGAAKAEEQAVAGQYDAGGRTLLTVINRLTDVLVAMRQER
ncbi:MAG TPA: hypothetical protein VJS13_14395 [Pyrinomonadaceae bacterium]|nr:hypothetical protein [Pyrinomonadaceae bacterium]